MKSKVDKVLEELSNSSDFLELKSGEIWFDCCCDCGARHANYLEIIRGGFPRQDRVFIHSVKDAIGTELQRDYERRKKAKSKR